jgi:hypothetical protein
MPPSPSVLALRAAGGGSPQITRSAGSGGSGAMQHWRRSRPEAAIFSARRWRWSEKSFAPRSRRRVASISPKLTPAVTSRFRLPPMPLVWHSARPSCLWVRRSRAQWRFRWTDFVTLAKANRRWGSRRHQPATHRAGKRPLVSEMGFDAMWPEKTLQDVNTEAQNSDVTPSPWETSAFSR